MWNSLLKCETAPSLNHHQGSVVLCTLQTCNAVIHPHSTFSSLFLLHKEPLICQANWWNLTWVLISRLSCLSLSRPFSFPTWRITLRWKLAIWKVGVLWFCSAIMIPKTTRRGPLALEGKFLLGSLIILKWKGGGEGSICRVRCTVMNCQRPTAFYNLLSLYVLLKSVLLSVHVKCTQCMVFVHTGNEKYQLNLCFNLGSRSTKGLKQN